MSVAKSFFEDLKQLKGRENFADWKFAVGTYLEHEDLLQYITNKTPVEVVDSATKEEKEAAKKAKLTRLKLVMLVDPVNYVHVRDAKTPAELWEKLHSAFEDTGLTRRVGLLRQLISTKLSNCESTEIYVNKIINAAHNLRNIKMDISYEWIGTLLLAGLPEKYQPMIMGIESSGIKITADAIKTKLLQDVQSQPTEDETALAAKFNKGKRDKSKVRCFNCNKLGHISSECKKPKEKVMLTSFVAREPNGSDEWYIDSGASGHMTMAKENLHCTTASTKNEVIVADNSRMKIDCVGDMRLSVKNDKRSDSVLVRNVQYIPKLCANLLSVSQIVKNGNTVTFDANGCRITDENKKPIATAELHNNMYKLVRGSKSQCFSAQIDEPSKQLLWHRRLVHPCHKKLKQLRDGLADGMQLSYISNDLCDVCQKGKQARKPFNNAGTRAKDLLEIVHSDVCGPSPVASMGGARYFLLFLDDFSRMIFVYILKQKSDVVDKFIEFQRFAENQTGKSIKILRSDNGSEYMNFRMKDITKSNGIVHQTSAPHSPQQNGMAERMNRTIVEKARCLLFDAKLSESFWAEAVSTAAYLINRSPTSGTKKTPFEIWFGSKPNLKDLRVFGCKSMAHIPKANRKKFDPKSSECILLGYSETSKAYRLYDKSKRRIIVSRDVTFMEKQTSEDEVIGNSKRVNKLFFFDSDEELSELASNESDQTKTASENNASSPNAFENAPSPAASDSAPEPAENENVTEANVYTPNPSVNTSDANISHPIVNANVSADTTFDSTINATVSGDVNTTATDPTWVPDNEDTSFSSDSSNATVVNRTNTDESFFDANSSSSSSMNESTMNSDTDYVPPSWQPGQFVRARSPVHERATKKAAQDAFKDMSFVVKSTGVGDPFTVKAAMSRADANLWKLAIQQEYDSLIKNRT